MPDFSAPEVRIDCVCSGGARAQGRLQGEALRERIHRARGILAELDSFRMQQPWWMPFPVFRMLAAAKADRYLRRGLNGNGAGHVLQRLGGIAEGAGIDRPLLHLFNAMEPFLAQAGRITSVPALGSCSAIAVRGSRSADGRPVIARNFDYLPVCVPLFCVRDERPADGLRALVFSAAPLSGAVDGINEAGLALTYDYAFAIDTGTPAATISMQIAEALARCRTTAEVVAFFRERKRWGAGILMAADAEGDVASLELSNTRMSARRPADGEDVLFHTNAYCTAEMQEVQLDRQAVYNAQAPPLVRGRRVLESPETRQARLAELLSDGAALGADDLQRVLSDCGPQGEPSANTITMVDAYWNTVASVQLFPQERRMRIAYDPPARAEFVELGL